jgi:phosphatidylglycerophosphate synthase
MTPRTARRIADGLTWARVASAVPLTLLAAFDLTGWFFACYVAAAFTDAFDGIFARSATGTESSAELDGRADVLFAFMTLVWVYMLIPGFYQDYGIPYVPLLVVLQGYLIYARINDADLILPHLEFGRFAVFLFSTLLPVLIVAGDVAWFVHLAFVTAITAKLQLVRHILSRSQQMDTT